MRDNTTRTILGNDTDRVKITRNTLTDGSFTFDVELKVFTPDGVNSRMWFECEDKAHANTLFDQMTKAFIV